MTLKALILLTLLSKVPHSRDTETWEQREARMEILADAVVSAVDTATCTDRPEDCQRIWPGSRKELAMLLVTLAHYESNFAQHIHEGLCRVEKGECDAHKMPFVGPEGKVLYRRVARSISPWQIQKYDIPSEDWSKIQSGLEGTGVAAWHAARRISSSYRSCGSIRGALGRYATGVSCEWSGAGPREAEWESLMRRSEPELERLVERRKGSKG